MKAILSRLSLGVRQGWVGLRLALTRFPDWKDAHPRKVRLLEKALESGWFLRHSRQRLRWLMSEEGAEYGKQPSLLPGLLRAAIGQDMRLNQDYSLQCLKECLKTRSLDLATFRLWFSHEGFWGHGAQSHPHPRHALELVPALSRVPPLELPDWLETMGDRFPGRWESLSVALGRDGTRAFLRLLFVQLARLPKDTPPMVALVAGERLGRWLAAHFSDRKQILQTNPMVSILFSLPEDTSLLARAWCSGVSVVFFEDIGAEPDSPFVLTGPVVMRAPGLRVVVDADRVAQCPWLACLPPGTYSLGRLLDLHPFWPTCLPEQVLRDILDAGVPAARGLQAGTNPRPRL
jgi:hypothetical protein